MTLTTDAMPTCQDMELIILPLKDAKGVTTSGTPPYYMLAYPLGGTPRVYDLAASGAGKYMWKSDWAPGTRLALQVVDSQHNTGGVDTKVYVSNDGPSSDCIKQDPAPSKDDKNAFTISANVTVPSRISTCDPWAVTVQGGTYPYDFTLVAINSSAVTNVSSVARGDDTLVWIDRAAPNGQLLVAASDSTGKYAYGTPLVYTQGSADAACPGLNMTFLRSSALYPSASSSTSASSPTSSSEGSGGDSSDKPNTTLIISVAVPVAVVALLAVLGCLWWNRRRKPQKNGANLGEKIVLTGYDGGEVGRRDGHVSGASLDYTPRPFEQRVPSWYQEGDGYRDSPRPGSGSFVGSFGAARSGTPIQGDSGLHSAGDFAPDALYFPAAPPAGFSRSESNLDLERERFASGGSGSMLPLLPAGVPGHRSHHNSGSGSMHLLPPGAQQRMSMRSGSTSSIGGYDSASASASTSRATNGTRVDSVIANDIPSSRTSKARRRSVMNFNEGDRSHDNHGSQEIIIQHEDAARAGGGRPLVTELPPPYHPPEVPGPGPSSLSMTNGDERDGVGGGGGKR
jgi:hypothetical protein